MKMFGKFIVGDPIAVDNYTADWYSVRMHPTSYYRWQEAITDSLLDSKGLYTEIDLGQFVVIRFSDKEDLTRFYRTNHQYV